MDLRQEVCPLVFSHIKSLLRTSQKKLLVAIDGHSGSGKTTLAKLMAEVYDAHIFHLDDFFLPPKLRTSSRLQEIGGNIHYERFEKEILRGLQSGKDFYYQAYNCQQDALTKPRLVQPKRLNIIEGSYSMHPFFRNYYDLTIFLEINPQEQSRRILKRNGPIMHKRFLQEWIPLENTYFTQQKIKELCDLVFSAF